MKLKIESIKIDGHNYYATFATTISDEVCSKYFRQKFRIWDAGEIIVCAKLGGIPVHGYYSLKVRADIHRIFSCHAKYFIGGTEAEAEEFVRNLPKLQEEFDMVINWINDRYEQSVAEAKAKEEADEASIARLMGLAGSINEIVKAEKIAKVKKSIKTLKAELITLQEEGV